MTLNQNQMYITDGQMDERTDVSLCALSSFIADDTNE